MCLPHGGKVRTAHPAPIRMSFVCWKRNSIVPRGNCFGPLLQPPPENLPVLLAQLPDIPVYPPDVPPAPPARAASPSVAPRHPPARSQDPAPPPHTDAPSCGPHQEPARRWASLIRRVYQVDPLLCPRCRSLMRVVSFITQPGLIRRILDLLAHGVSSEQAERRHPRSPSRPQRRTAPPSAGSRRTRTRSMSVLRRSGQGPS